MLFILVLLVFMGRTNAQLVSIGYSYGYGSYRMNSLKNLQEYRTLATSMPLKIVKNFPVAPYYYTELTIAPKNDKSVFGLFYEFLSTGGRSTLSDYSGRIDLDALVNDYQAGVAYYWVLKGTGRWYFGGYVNAAYHASRLTLRDNLDLIFPDNYSYEKDYHYRSHGIMAEPGIYGSCSFGPLQLKVKVGYSVSTAQQFYLLKSKSTKLSSGNESVKPEWQGFRIGLLLSLTIK
jgi:hypothetical protein